MLTPIKFTPYQSSYFAHWLTQSGKIDQQVSRTVASARVDMNPHQIEAACFALKSPLSKGALLADEVGLGKTIEASLVMAQKWAEHKRHILLVVPASLRKQWSQELLDKFELTSLIVDRKVLLEQRKEGQLNPFDQQEAIVICSYEFVASQKEMVRQVNWDLVVFDEAHKLRNIYQEKGKRVKAVVEATAHASSRVLLSATPIQNHLMELYGLASIIDPHYFGDADSFRSLYVSRRKTTGVLDDLKKRIEPLCHRTLRRQVQEEGGINFTNRYSITQDFTPTPEEWDLYCGISNYLQDPNIQAIAPNARHLVSIGMRKTLASSSFAIADTLKVMIKRLREKQLLNDEVLQDLESADDWSEQFGDENEEPVEQPRSFYQQKLDEEITLLADFQERASNISENAKGQALLTVLNKALDMTETLGGQRKAVVFTESVRTQKYLSLLLEQNGFAGRTLLLNGSNTDARSTEVYNAWKAKHQGSARISGTRSADMKAALVEHFKSDEADILISTEAGGEGINLQFCSLLINYDLPWNPQKVEQRIGRVHRYGQKNDVVVVNFVNQQNTADQRTFKLLNDKFKLFEGVFGASDEILGALEGDIDIERRIYEIYQDCRTAEAIDRGFDQLQQDMDDKLSVREKEATFSLFSHFDRDVVARLKGRRDSNVDFLRDYEQVLLDLARAELPQEHTQFKENHFFYKGQRYDIRWELAQQHDAEFFRLQANEHFLAWELIRRAKERQLDAAYLHFNYSALQGGQYGALRERIGQKGRLQLVKLTFNYADTKEDHLLALACTDDGRVLPQDQAEHLLCIPASVVEGPIELDASTLQPLLDDAIAAKQLQTEEQLEIYFDQENDKLERWAEDRRQALMMTVEAKDAEIKELKKAARQLASTAEKVTAKKQLRTLERQRDDALSEYHAAKKLIEQEEDKLLDEISAKLELKTTVETLFSIRWALLP